MFPDCIFPGQNRFQMKENLILSVKMLKQAKIGLLSPELWPIKVSKIQKNWFFKGQKNHQRITRSISKTLNVNCSGLNRSILACNTNFPHKIKCSFIWNRFWPENRKFRKKFRFSGQFFEIFGIGCIPIRGSKYIFLDFIGSNLSKNTTFITVAFFGYLSLLWSCCVL